MARMKKKVFVLDTNVILHDSDCIYHFDKNDVIVPITVLEELDQFKKGNETINFHAREFVRTLDSLSGNLLFNGGVKIGKGKGKIKIKLEQEFHKDLEFSFTKVNPDHRILNTAYQFGKDNPTLEVILVSKDVNLRMKAKSISLMSQNYTSDHVKDLTSIYKGSRIEENITTTQIDRMYQLPFEITISELQIENQLMPNEYLIMRSGKKSAIGVYNKNSETIKRIDKSPVYGIMPRNAEQIFALNALTNPEIKLVTITGKAGTGKTLLALAASLEKRKYYQQIFLARPIVPLSNKDIGFLPGDIESKLNPYMQPLFDNLGVIKNQFQSTKE